MDELTFNQNTPNTDTTQNIEGYDNQVEEIQKSYPEQDWRTPAQVEAEEQGQVEGQAPVQPQDQITEVANQVGQQLGITPQPQEAPQEQPEVEERTPGRFANQVDPATGLVSVEALRSANVSDEVIRITNAQYDWLPQEKTDFDSWREAGGDDNLEA